MQVLSSLKEAKKRSRDCQVVRRRGRIYVICKSGGRSAQAAEYLEQARGLDNVVNVEGGTTAWVEADLPHQRG